MLPLLLIILLFEGFVTISVEILTMRQLTPFYGNSVVITSLIIGFFLLFLALGYWRGGVYRENFLGCLTRNFLLSLLWIGVGLSYALIAVFFNITIAHLSFPFLLSLIAYLFIILAPIVYWLGQTIPITTNLFNQNKGVSVISGRALFLSTAGSFLGALVTSLIFFQYFGVAWTVVINCFLLGLLLVILQKYDRFSLWKCLLLILSLIVIKNINVDVEKIFFKVTNNYANYALIDLANHVRILKINESNSSLIDKNNQGFPYIQWIRELLFKQLQIKNQQILVIGAGGFSLTANGSNGNEVTYVDIDPDIKKLSEKYFLKKPIAGTFIGEDARSFLNRSQVLYDVIISDAYTNTNAIPPSLLTREYFEQLLHHLKPSGLVIINIIGNPMFQNNYIKRVDNTIRYVFGYCAMTPLDWRNSITNMMYVCTAAPSDAEKYTDDLNKSTLDFFRQ